MNYNLKRFLAVFFVIIIAAGWYLTIFGAGPVDPLKDRIKLGLDIKGGVYVVMEAKTDLTGDELKKAMEQTQTVIEERVNQLGLAEPVVTIEGDKRIRVELPGRRTGSYRTDRKDRTAAVCTGRRHDRARRRKCKGCICHHRQSESRICSGARV